MVRGKTPGTQRRRPSHTHTGRGRRRMARWRPQPQGATWAPRVTDHPRREGPVQRAWCGKGKLRPFRAGPGVHCKDALPTRRTGRGSSWAGPVPSGGVSKHLRWPACHPVCSRTGPRSMPHSKRNSEAPDRPARRIQRC